MGILNAIFKRKETTNAVEAVGNVLDELFTSTEEKEQAKAVLEKLRQQPDVLQVELNKVEAGHRSVFVAGWRPFIGWVCGFGFAYHYILQPFLAFTLLALGVDLPALPEFDMNALQTVMMGMLGLGTLRTWEKLQGKAK